MQKHLFIMDHFSGLNRKMDSSLRMAYYLSQKGCQVFSCEINDLFRQTPGGAQAWVGEIQFSAGPESAARAASEKALLNMFDGIHMRKDPPFDLAYMSALWILDAIDGKTKVLNAPRTLMRLNEKLSIMDFPEYSLPALVSGQATDILNFVKDQCGGDGIIKPLHLFSGRGIARIQTQNQSDDDALRQIEDMLAEDSPRIVQGFNHKIAEGEVRIFTAGGKTLSWCLKRPAPGSYLANTSAGATLEEYQPTEDERKMVSDISQRLLKEGVFYIGYDIIGGAVSEINITSPRLLTVTDEAPLYQSMAAEIMDYCR